MEVLALSGVFQYLPARRHLLDGLLSQILPAAVIIDRTTTRRGASRWFLQTQPGVCRQPVADLVQVLEYLWLLAAFRGCWPVRHLQNASDPGRPVHIIMLSFSDDPAGAKG